MGYYCHYFQFGNMQQRILSLTNSDSRYLCPEILEEILTGSCSVLRVIFMVPVYSIVSFLSVVYYRHAIYFHLLSDTYSAIAVSSGYALFAHYVAPDLHEQKQYFRSIQPKQWLWPVSWFGRCCGSARGPWRTPRSGLTWLNVCQTFSNSLNKLISRLY